MRDTCIGCSCLEWKNKRPFCFYYESYRETMDGCGNDFKVRPEFTQDESEEIAFCLADKYVKIPNEEKDRIFKETDEWPDEFDEDIKQAVEKAQEEMRQKKIRRDG